MNVIFRFLGIAICFTSIHVLAADHVGECTKREGIERARCERHIKMAEKCGSLKGEAHFTCDREFLVANPLVCEQQGDARSQSACAAEVKAFKTCEPKLGVEFMKCVKATTGQSPMGH
jgi:hypothetical protein